MEYVSTVGTIECRESPTRRDRSPFMWNGMQVETQILFLFLQGAAGTGVMWKSRRDSKAYGKGGKPLLGFPGFPYAVISTFHCEVYGEENGKHKGSCRKRRLGEIDFNQSVRIATLPEGLPAHFTAFASSEISLLI